MRAGFQPLIVEQLRPLGMNSVEAFLWETMSAASEAAFHCFTSPGAAVVSIDGLEAIAQNAAAVVLERELPRLVATAYMREWLILALSAEAVATARTLCADLSGPDDAVGLPS